MTDDDIEQSWFYCPGCCDDYLLPEDSENCPLCESELESLGKTE